MVVSKDVKVQAAHRWVEAVNADGQYGKWRYALAEKIADVERSLRLEGVGP